MADQARAAPTRTEAICRAILNELRTRRTLIDANGALASISVTCYLQDGPEMVRSTSVEEHTRLSKRRA